MKLDEQAKADMAIFEAIIADNSLAMKELLRMAWMNGFMSGLNNGHRLYAKPFESLTARVDRLCKVVTP